jgi:hypothetical protein
MQDRDFNPAKKKQTYLPCGRWIVKLICQCHFSKTKHRFRKINPIGAFQTLKTPVFLKIIAFYYSFHPITGLKAIDSRLENRRLHPLTCGPVQKRIKPGQLE